MSAATGFAAEDFRFRNISVQQGLSQETVYALAQDARGYIWMGTQAGLNKFNGTVFRTYYHNPDDRGTLASNHVFSLCCTDEGQLYVGTNTGVSRYVPESDSFVNYDFPCGEVQVYDMLYLADSGEMLIATDMGLYVFNPGSAQIETVSSDSGIVLSLSRFRNDAVLVGTGEGIYFYYIPDRTMTRIFHQLGNMFVSDIAYNPVLEDIWIATLGKGLYRADRNFYITGHFTADGASRPVKNFRRVEIDNDGRIWAGTLNGIFYMHPNADSFEYVNMSDDMGEPYPDISVRSILKDREGGIWIGTFRDGCFHYDNAFLRFRSVMFPGGNNRTYVGITCMAEDTLLKKILVGHSEKGLYVFEPETMEFSKFRLKNATRGIERIKCILPSDRDGYVYVGTHLDGIFRIDTRSGTVVRKKLSASVSESNSVYSLYDTGNGNLLIGSGRGLYVMDKKSLRTYKVNAEGTGDFEKSLISDIQSDSGGKIWFATDKGVFVSDSSCRDFVQIKYPVSGVDSSIPANEILCSSRSAAIWINSFNGFFRYDMKSGTFIRYSQDDGLPTYSFKGMMEDGVGNIWMNSDRGIIFFNPDNKYFNLYTDRDGVLPNRHRSSGFLCTDDGVFICVGGDGLNMFRPERLYESGTLPVPVISGCYIQGRPVTPSMTDTEIAFNSYGELSSVSYPSAHSGLTVAFSTVDMRGGSPGMFAYKLEGMDNDWIYTNFPNVTYPELGAGNYRLLVKAVNGEGVMSEQYGELEISVLPRWYERWYFKGIMFLLAGIAALLIIYGYLNHSRMRTALLWEQKDKRRVQETNEEKIRFYTNISHELRTPINLILSPLEELVGKMKDLPQDISEKIRFIYHNSLKLNTIISQELDLRRTESEVLPLLVAPNDITEIVEDVFSSFYYEFRKREQEAAINNELSGTKVWCDRSYVEKILTCLLSNAVKFTPAKGSISISMKGEDGMLCLVVENSGDGISSDRLERIFERFYKADENHYGFGIGLYLTARLVEKHHGKISVESTPGKMTVFTVRIPMEESSYLETEKHDSTDNKSITSAKSIYGFVDEYGEKVNDAAGPVQSQDNAERPTILLATDNEDMGRYMASFFEKEYRLIVTDSAESTISALRNENIGLVVCDFSYDGDKLVQLCTRIKRNIQTSHIPIMLLSDKDEHGLQLDLAKAGVDEFLVKPVSIFMIDVKIKNMFLQKDRLYSHMLNKFSGEYSIAAVNASDKEFVEQVITAIDANISDESFSPENLAAVLNMSRSNLYSKMNEIIGEPPANFIRRLRIDRSCRYLAEGRYRISEISELVGFATPSYFSICFKKQKGCLPKEYVQKLRDKQIPQS